MKLMHFHKFNFDKNRFITIITTSRRMSDLFSWIYRSKNY